VNARDAALFDRLTRRVGLLTPDLMADLRRSYILLLAALPEEEVARLILTASIDRIVAEMLNADVLMRAFVPYRDGLHRGTLEAMRYYRRDLPGNPPTPRTVTITFDVLNPRVLDGIKALDTRVMTTLHDQVRETFRQHVAAGLEDGVNPRTIARGLRDVLPLAPNQELAVRNFRRALLGQSDASPFAYKLRDKRFDARVRAGNLTDEQIDRYTAAYRKRMIAFNAETNARTAALDAQKAGQRLTWDDAIARGDVDPVRLQKRWSTVMDGRERPTHHDMNGEVVPYDQPFSNGQMIPGDTEFNCRCLAIYTQARGNAVMIPIRRGVLAGAGAMPLPR
jgi:hypothetical protein